MMATTGRGGWTKTGMPSNGTGYYQLLSPVQVGSQPQLGMDYLAVAFGVKAIQTRMTHLSLGVRIVIDGNFGPGTSQALILAQKKLGVAADGQFGPKTSLAFFWPVIKDISSDPLIRHTVGGITAHESAYDPGAVGYTTPDDHGLVQINAPANPTISIAMAFDYRFALLYCSNRIANAYATYKNIDIAVASYASPAWAKQWYDTGVPPNQFVVDYANFVKNWVAPA
jgi:peptidoglycan hydrolase-like protein with peptidoglycan-binding domain